MMLVPLLFTVTDKFAYLALKSACSHSLGQTHSLYIEFPFCGLLICRRFWILRFLSLTLIFVTFWFVMVGMLFFVTLSRNSTSTRLSFIVEFWWGCGLWQVFIRVTNGWILHDSHSWVIDVFGSGPSWSSWFGCLCCWLIWLNFICVVVCGSFLLHIGFSTTIRLFLVWHIMIGISRCWLFLFMFVMRNWQCGVMMFDV